MNQKPRFTVKHALTCLCLLSLTFPKLQAQNDPADTVPNQINYQGTLFDSNGNALATGQYVLTFRIYSAESDGTLLWGPQTFEDDNAVTVVDGQFNIILGPNDDTDDTNTTDIDESKSLYKALEGTSGNAYLEITVGDETVNTPISPRQQILVTPYALHAENANFALPDAVNSAAIIDGTITSADIGDGTITGTDIANDTITSDDFTEDLRTSLFSTQLGSDKIADDAITSAKIADGTITTVDIGNGQVTSDKIDDGTITSKDLSTLETIQFASNLKQKLNLLAGSNAYGIGVQSHTHYFRTNHHFAWYNQGSHIDGSSSNLFNAGTGGTTLMVLKSNGYLGIGTTDPSEKLHVNGKIKTHNGGIVISSPDSTFDDWSISHGSSSKYLTFRYNNATRAQISDSNGSYLATSDITLKEDISNIDPVLSKVIQMRPVDFYYKDQVDREEKVIGFIAQEMQPLFPEIVNSMGDGKLGISYATVSVIAIKAIQEQQAIIEAQQAEIETLKSEQATTRQQLEGVLERLEQLENNVK